MTSARLTEAEVHSACADIASQGERPTALTLLEKLGRGSLTTITKYLNSWNASDEAKVLGAESLPTVVKLPPELTKDGEELIKKIWAVAKGIADEELDIQKNALKQAELNNQAKVEEAFKFSEAQAMKIERLEDTISELRVLLEREQNQSGEITHKLNEAEKIHVGVSKDNERLQSEIDKLKKQVLTLEEANNILIQEKQHLQEHHEAILKEKDAENRTLDVKVQTLQSSLDLVTQAGEELKKELQGSRVATMEAQNLVANLEGQLSVYKSIEKTRVS
jgi:DNA repair exonuclease SbcCD ATPase subunit